MVWDLSILGIRATTSWKTFWNFKKNSKRKTTRFELSYKPQELVAIQNNIGTEIFIFKTKKVCPELYSKSLQN